MIKVYIYYRTELDVSKSLCLFNIAYSIYYIKLYAIDSI